MLVLNVHALECEIEAAMREAQVPGLAISIVRGEGMIYTRGFGVTSMEEGGIPVTPRTLFRIGSLTKPLTGTAIMRLVDDGQIGLDRPVRRYLPWFAVSDPSASERITIRMLLTHTSGLPHDHKPFGRRDPEALEARVRHEVPRYPLVAPAGTTYLYSNTGIHVLAHVAEVVTGKLYPQLMHDLVFAPLAMDRTTFDPTVAMTYPHALSHRLAEDGSLRVEHRYADNAANYASGQAISTVLDLSNFAAMQLHHGAFAGQRVLSSAAIQEMHRPHGPRPSGVGTYGLTFGLRTYKGITRVLHGGAITNFGATLEMAPEQGVAVVAAYNRLDQRFRIGQIVDGIFDGLLDLPASGNHPAGGETP